jgi:peptidylprolyl isomerase
MKYVYLIGILLAVVVLSYLGLDKGRGKPSPSPTPATQASTTLLGEEAITSTTTKETTMLIMKTTLGDITLELYTKDMPITTGNFLALVKKGFYDDTLFHRVIDGFMIQGGDPLTKDASAQMRWGTGGPGYAIQDEFAPQYGNVRGSLAMANAGPNTGGSQFFINVADNNFLNGKHPVFGKVVSGMEVVDAIVKTPRDRNDRPLTSVKVISVVETE